MAANSAGLQILPKSFGPEYEAGNTVKVCGNEIKIHGPSERDSVLASLYDEYPNMIVVDYTLPTLVNGKILGAYDT
jgi:4-hydroxy-tetrahydrodipicolinate reductase